MYACSGLPADKFQTLLKKRKAFLPILNHKTIKSKIRIDSNYIINYQGGKIQQNKGDISPIKETVF